VSRYTISVVITTFNRPECLDTAIQSVVAQTRPPDEIIVVDEGESAPTRAVVDKYPGVRYVWKEDDGPSGARNAGLALASGDLINFLDDDDWFLPRKLEIQAALFESHPEADVVYCRLRKVTPDQQFLGEYLTNHRPPKDFLLSLLRENFILTHSALVRRKSLKAVGGFDPDRDSSEEYEGWIRMALAGANFLFCDEVLGAVRVSPGSLSSNRYSMFKKIEKGYRRNREALRPFRDRAGREWWMAGPAYNRGRYALENGDLSIARESLKQALHHNPLHGHALMYLAFSMLPGQLRRLLLSARSLKRYAVSVLTRILGGESRWT